MRSLFYGQVMAHSATVNTLAEQVQESQDDEAGYMVALSRSPATLPEKAPPLPVAARTRSAKRRKPLKRRRHRAQEASGYRYRNTY